MGPECKMRPFPPRKALEMERTHRKRTHTPQISEPVSIPWAKSTRWAQFIRPHYFQRGRGSDYLELLRRSPKANTAPDKDSGYENVRLFHSSYNR